MAAKKLTTTNQNKVQQFDYTGFPKDVQTTLHKRVDNLKQLGNTATQTFLEIGKELAAAREEIQPFRDGGFQEWVHVELGITEQYAYQLINVYEQFGKDASKLNLLAGLSNTVLREISAPSVPQEARDTVVAKAQAGEKVSVAQAKDIVKQAKQPKQPDVDNVGNELANVSKAMPIALKIVEAPAQVDSQEQDVTAPEHLIPGEQATSDFFGKTLPAARAAASAALAASDFHTVLRGAVSSFATSCDALIVQIDPIVKHIGEFSAEDWNNIHLVRLNLTRVAELLAKYEEKRPGAKPVKGAKK